MPAIILISSYLSTDMINILRKYDCMVSSNLCNVRVIRYNLPEEYRKKLIEELKVIKLAANITRRKPTFLEGYLRQLS